MARSSPVHDLEELFDRMSEKFEEKTALSVDVTEDDEAVTVTADLPGYDRDDIDVTVEDRRLTISAEREREETEKAEEEFHRRERSFRRQTRTIRLPADIDKEATSATYQNGVLEITLPKAEEETGHTVEIE